MGAFMNQHDPWENPWHSIPIEAMPGKPIGLQSAVRLIVERNSCIAGVDVEDGAPAISSRAEFMNMCYGGSKLKADLEERAELMMAAGIQEAARNWLKEHLRTGELRLFRDGGPRKVWVCEPEFWRRTDHHGVFMQTSMLDREGDEKGTYVTDRASLMALLEIGPATHESEDAGNVGAGAPGIVVNRPTTEVVGDTAAPAPTKHESEGATRVGESTSAPLGPARRTRSRYVGALKMFIARKNPEFLSRIDVDGLERQFRAECQKSGDPKLPQARHVRSAIRKVRSQLLKSTTAGERNDNDG